jgi:exodeoxyribonuclease V
MRFELSAEQKQILEAVLSWKAAPKQPYLTLGGYAGTGKTTLMAFLRIMLYKLQPELPVAFCAYTGKASRVLANTLEIYKAKQAKDSVSTIHSLVYAPLVDKSGQVTGWQRRQEIKAKLIIVDEASMVDRGLFEDLLAFGVPILAVGDHGQLPPINPGFNLMARPDLRLETIHRQAADNPIIKLSMLARTEGRIPVGNFGAGVRKVNKYEAEAAQEVESLLMSQRKELLVLVGFNKSRLLLNTQMRSLSWL